MQAQDHIAGAKQPLGLREFIPLGITYFIGLVFLALYQQTALYYFGVLDGIIGKSFFLLVVHHLGFASVCALVLAFLFNFLEAKKPHLGLKMSKVVVISLLISESLLTTYYIQNYEALGAQWFRGISASTTMKFSWVMALMALVTVLGLCFFAHKRISRSYVLISRMYPATLIMFSMFLATLASDTKEVNENKTQHLLSSISQQFFSTEDFEGLAEFPLLRPYTQEETLDSYFIFKDAMPHIKIVVMEGLGADFVGKGKPYSAFMPYLNQLQQESLYWPHFLSNTGESHAAIPSITGSLPFGQEGFTKLDAFLYRNTLFSILRANGYATSFAYGGNTTLFGFDKFLAEEGVTTMLDKNAFGVQYAQQGEDAAGISLGYPDAALYDRYQNMPSGQAPRLDVLLTLSTKAPYLIPEADHYALRVTELLEQQDWTKRNRRFIAQHDALFASYLYADSAFKGFMAKEKQKETFGNTIYIIVGSHYSTDMPHEDQLTRYKVPLLIYSPLLKKPGVITEIASHVDLAPTLLAQLDGTYPLNVPQQVAWLGWPMGTRKKEKDIPLLRGPNNLQEFIKGSHLITEADVFQLNDTLGLSPAEDEGLIRATEQVFLKFKSINAYVTQQNKIMPKEISLVMDQDETFTKEELVWIHSVFNGDNFDNAYATAHTLALDKEWERAKLLCSYILNEIPRHADTEILLGRLHGWQKDYTTSIALLEKTVRKYPKYADAYCALMDSYYWAGHYDKVATIKDLAAKNTIGDALLNEKIKRAETLLKRQNIAKTTTKATNISFQDNEEQRP